MPYNKAMRYDPFQEEAIARIKEGYSVIVSAPTGAGKTVIAEHVIRDCLERGEKVIYTAPIKALSNQKYRDFQVHFPDKVGILTGDVSINSHAPALIMTTEIFRNKILEEKAELYPYSWIIFDEIHYIDDYERGGVWEESLMFLPEHMKVLGLSATIPNIDELAEWFAAIHHKPIKIVKESRRPVPLHIFYQCQNKVYDKLKQLSSDGFRSPEYRQFQGRKIPRFAYVKSNRLDSLVNHFTANGMLPAIYFAFSRRKTEYYAEELLHYNFLNEAEQAEIGSLFDELIERYDLGGDAGAAKIKPFIERGIAYHHAGMLPTLKEVVEQLFTSRLIKMIFTTETFALGINMPARTVIFDELRKFYGRSFSVLKTRDFYQMAGRAGRRSIDKEGFVFCRINPHYISPRDVHKTVTSDPEPVRSRFNASYATVLNLYQRYGDKLYDIYPLSFHYYQESKRWRKKALDILRAKVRLLKEYGYIRKNRLTEKGIFAGKVYGYEFILSELFATGSLEELSPTELGILCAAVVYEPRKKSKKPPLHRGVKRLEHFTGQIMRPVIKREKKERIRPVSKEAFFHLANAMEAWLKGESFEDMLRHTDADEGEIVRYFRMSIQIMREILDAPVSHDLKSKLENLIRKINRDVVDAEKQLRV